MASKKIPIGLNPAEAELEHRVEVMMEPVKVRIVDKSTSTTAVTPAPEPVSTIDTAPIDIFSDSKTAPEIPSDLQIKLAQSSKKISVTAADSPVAAGKVAAPTVSPPAPAVQTTPAVRVPQLIASTAPKLTPMPKLKPVEPVIPVLASLTTDDAAPSFDDATGVSVNTNETAITVPSLQIDDPKTDAAIAAIAASDSDQLLAVQDAMSQDVTEQTAKKPAKTRRNLLLRPWFYLLALALLLFAGLALPLTRYKLAGLIIKQDQHIAVLDSKTNRPVSNATLTIDGQTVTTDASGAADLRLPVGPHNLTISRQYYASQTRQFFIDFKKPATLDVTVLATGRQVPILVTDKLTGKPIANAEISVLTTNAKTDKQGKAIIVLPTKTQTIDGRLTAANFNNNLITIQITDGIVAANSFALTPAGKVYFLSNQQGTIDVVKTNLDGSGRQTVLKGTGKEDAATTVLLTARDWRYSVLKSQRDSSQAALYLIDTSTDKLTQFDSGDSNFTPIGWTGHNFLYDVVRNAVATSQNAHEQIKSYDAERGQLNQLDASQADGEGTAYRYQGFYNFFILNNLLVYNTQWYSSGGAALGTKNDTIRGVEPNGQNKKDYQDIPAAGLGYIQAALANPQDVYFSAYNFNDSKTAFYEFQNQGLKASTTVNQATFNKTYPAYVLSPSGNQALWSEQRDGKSVVLTGAADATKPQILTNLAGFSAYGWYSDDYLLVSKKGSELYIVASNGNGAPVKLTDYYRPAQSITGNGFGYGGL